MTLRIISYGLYRKIFRRMVSDLFEVILSQMLTILLAEYLPQFLTERLAASVELGIEML